ncbi:replication-relaxation family protein [Anoxybacillus sp. LAT_26]|uniref:replication-relaxation family protein n=1 Tax=Anoxybacillus sp. LAT_26 TaxID=2862719 RepID=UPI001EECB950|nr:replication-relaxation family protein [Anoxybacillus sp. LAT_26]
MFDLGSKRNANRILHGIRDYTHTKRIGEDVYYLNKNGAELVGGEAIIRRNSPLEHIVMRNDIYIFYHYPRDWKAEVKTRWTEEGKEYSVVSDARFKYHDLLYFLEVDNTQKMIENRRKIEKYMKLFRIIEKKRIGEPVLLWYTLSDMRKKQLEAWCREDGVKCEVLVKR